MRTLCFLISGRAKLTEPNTSNVRHMQELFEDALSTHHLDPSDRPPNRVYISLLQHFRMCGTDNGFHNRRWKGSCVATAIALSNSSIRCAQRSILSEQELYQLRDDLAHCLKCLDEFSDRDLESIMCVIIFTSFDLERRFGFYYG